MYTLSNSKSIRTPSYIPQDNYARSKTNLYQHSTLFCAFHTKERITNFCKDSNCLLPLCPKCIKIHSDQHARSGIFGEFETINECFNEAQQQYGQIFQQVEQLSQLALNVQVVYQEQIGLIKQEFELGKKKMYDYIESLFNQYQEIMNDSIGHSQKKLFDEVKNYQDMINSISQSCKNGMKKLKNPNMKLEGLIMFYSQNQFKYRMQNYQEKIKQVIMNIIKVKTSDLQLQKISPIFKKYLSFQYHSQPYGPFINQYKSNRRFSNQEHTYSRTNTIQHNPHLDFKKSIISKMTYQRQQQIKNQFTDLQRYQTPLDNYSLQKSRELRMTILSNRQQ